MTLKLSWLTAQPVAHRGYHDLNKAVWENTLSAFSRAIEAGFDYHLVKPVDIPQIAPTIEAALKRASELSRLRNTGRQLEQALDQQRGVSVAVGILMERHRWSRTEAELRLRDTARAQRRKMADLAEAIVFAADVLALSAMDGEQRDKR